MKHTHTTHCALRLGDNLAHLHFLRKMAAAYPEDTFLHLCHPEYLAELNPVVADIDRIALRPLEQTPGIGKWQTEPLPDLDSINSWKNHGGFWQDNANRNCYSVFMLDWFRFLAREMGRTSPLSKPEDLLFDYPALKGEFRNPFDWLIVNSNPLSGQARQYRDEEMNDLILALADKARIVTTQRCPFDMPCTQDLRADATGIGRLSQMCHGILMVSTGPSWPTFNVWNRETVKRRIIICEPEIVDLAPNSVFVAKVSEARKALEIGGHL